MADQVKEGTVAPEIELQTDTEADFDLAKHKGRNVVLYFYPKADTPGCTIEAHEFNDALKQLARHDADVYGISPDTPKAQAKFKGKCDLKFPYCATWTIKLPKRMACGAKRACTARSIWAWSAPHSSSAKTAGSRRCSPK